MVTWIVETGIFVDEDDNESNLIRDIESTGATVFPLSWKDVFEHGTKFALPKRPECGIFLGSIGTAKDFVYPSCVWYDLERLDCVTYYPQLSGYLLNQNYLILPYGDLPYKADFVYRQLGENDTVFMRPTRADKIFTGQLVYREDYEKCVARFGFYDDDPTNLVIVAEPQNLVNEWRFFVVDGKVITGALYRSLGKSVDVQITEDDVVFGQAQKFADIWQPQKLYTLDLCETKAGDVKILEIGAFSCSGQYASDISKLVKAVTDFLC